MKRIIGGLILAIITLANALGIDIGVDNEQAAHITETIIAAIGFLIFMYGTIQRIVKELKTGKRKWYVVVLSVFSALKNNSDGETELKKGV